MAKVMEAQTKHFDKEEPVTESFPSWLTKEFVEETLRKFFSNEDINVDHMIINNCHPGGYVSSIFRVAVHQNSNEKFKSIIVKALPESEMALKLFEGVFGCHTKEMTFYEKILPELEKILSEIGEDGKTFPKVIAADRELGVIVLEDKSQQSFLIDDKVKGLDENQIKMSLKALSRMHAASLVLYEKDQKAFEGFEFGLFSEKMKPYSLFLKIKLQAFAEEIDSWSEWDKSSYFAEKLKNMANSSIDNSCKAFEFDERNLNVLCHGDLWTNNILFNYPSSAVLIDFQFSVFGSASIDLLYFLLTSYAEYFRTEKLEEMVQFYYCELKSLLEKLNFNMKKLPSLKDFQVEFFKNFFHGFASCFVLLHPMLANRENAASVENIAMADEVALNFVRKLHQDPNFKKYTMRILPIFDRRGILDI